MKSFQPSSPQMKEVKSPRLSFSPSAAGGDVSSAFFF